MARATRLLLPTELLIKIFKFCEEYDWQNDAHAERLVEPKFDNGWVGTLTWLRVARSSKDDICNLRLVCRQLREASTESFGWVLRDRTFRLTKLDLQDLQDIAAVPGLPQWIKTLTFGSADVSDPHVVFQMMLDHSKHDEDMHGMLSSIHQAWRQYTPLSRTEIMQRLQTSLKAFAQLKNLQMVVQDNPKYLRGWLTKDQREYIDTDFEPNSPFWDVHSEWFRPEDFYDSKGLYTAHSVLKAFSEVGGHVQDLKLSIAHSLPLKISPGILRYILPETLCSLHMSIAWIEFKFPEGEEHKGCSGDFFNALLNLHNLQDLALHLTDHDYEAHWADKLFQSFQQASKLQRFVLKGRWTLSPTSLINFVDGKVPTLRSLILEGCCLDGTFWTALHSLATVIRGRLEYLRMWHISEPKGITYGSYFGPVEMDSFLQSQWPRFTCITDFGPDFHLLPDPIEEEDS